MGTRKIVGRKKMLRNIPVGDQFVSTYKEIQQLQKYLEKILNENMDRKTALEKKEEFKYNLL